MKKHPKYKTKEGDTIQTISERFGMEEDIWKIYHNNSCRLTDVIRNDIPVHLTEIFLHPELWNKADDLNKIDQSIHTLFNEKQEIILYNKKILFFAPYNLSNRYGVIMNFGKDKIHYEIEVKYIEHLTHEVFRISIDRKQVYINNQEPDLKLYEMADQMAKSIYPLILDINKEKKIQAIVNHKDIQLRCNDVQKKLSQYFVGEYAERYIQLFEKQVDNPNTLINHLENELFYQLFFLPIQGMYDERLTREAQYSHVSDKNKVTVYNLNVSLNNNYTESGKIIAKIHSDETLNTKNCFKAEYRLYPEDHSIFSMRGNLILLNDKNKECNTYFEIYHLNTNERVIKRDILSRKESSLVNEQRKKTSNTPERQKKFWDIFK